MRRVVAKSLAIAILLGGVAVAQNAAAPAGSGRPQAGESLGEVARENLAKKQVQEANGKAPKVITNQDLPAGSTGIPESSESQPMTMVSGIERPDRFAGNEVDRGTSNRWLAEQRAGEQWRQRIAEQENRIADLQARIDRVSAAMQRYGGTAQYETPMNRYQANQMERLAMMHEVLDRQKQRLAMMEDAARHAGMER